MNKNKFDMTDEELIAAARGTLPTEHAVTGIMQAVREARLDDTMAAPVRRRDRAAAWAFAAAGIAVLSLAIGREWIAARNAAPSIVSPRIAITDSPNAALPRAIVASLPNDIQIAIDAERGAVLEGAHAVHIDRPMRLSLVNGALRVEPNTGTTPPGR